MKMNSRDRNVVLGILAVAALTYLLNGKGVETYHCNDGGCGCDKK